MSSRNSDRDGGIAGAREEGRGQRAEPPLFLTVLSTLAAVAPRLSWRDEMGGEGERE
jgi:hypothetical protein